MSVLEQSFTGRESSPVEWTSFREIECELESCAQQNGKRLVGYEEAMQGVSPDHLKQQRYIVWWLQLTLERLGLIDAYRKHFLALHPTFAELANESLGGHGNVIEHCNAVSWAIAKPE